MSGQWQNGEFRVHVAYNVGCDGFDIFLGYKDFAGKRLRLLPAQFTENEPRDNAPWIAAGTEISSRAVLQGFMDVAWEQGIRPREWNDTKLQLKATQDHLRDMRAIVAGKLKVVLP